MFGDERCICGTSSTRGLRNHFRPATPFVVALAATLLERAGYVMKREFFSDDIRRARTVVSQNHEDIIVVPPNGHKADLEDTKGCA